MQSHYLEIFVEDDRVSVAKIDTSLHLASTFLQVRQENTSRPLEVSSESSSRDRS